VPRIPSLTPSMTKREEVIKERCVYVHAHASIWRHQGTENLTGGWVAHRACLGLRIYGGG